MKFNNYLTILALFLLFIQAPFVFAAENTGLGNWMEASGFENINLLQRGDTLILTYENRIFRHEAEAIAFFLKEMPLPESKEIILLPQYLNISMLRILVNVNQLRLYRNHEINSTDFINTITFNLNTDQYSTHHHKNPRNPSFFKADLMLEPKLSMQLGNFDRPIQVLAELAPTLQMQLRKGLLLNAQLLIPVYNNLKVMEGASVRNGIISLSQNFRLPDNFFVTATAGIFSFDRLGADLKTKKYFLNGRLGFYTQMGYSTWTKFDNSYESRYFDRANYFIGRIGAEFRYAKYDLLLSASYGNFLYQDKGWRFDIFRQFNDLMIGFVGILTSETYNAGFYLSVPLLPKKYTRINKVRIRPSHYFNWGYNFRGQTYAGKNYSTGENILQKTTDFNPYFIKNQLNSLLKN